MVHENQTYASVMDLVRTRYSVGVETAVTLTYEFPEWMKAPGDLSPPPVDVKEDGEVELFMSIRIELPATRLMVTIGNEVVARYLFQRRDNYTVIGSSRDITNDNTQRYRSTSTGIGYAKPGAGNSSAVPAQDGAAFWEEMLAQCIMTASHQFLTGVCEAEDEAFGGKEALGGMMAGLNVSIGNTDVTDSSTDSSADPVESGIIRLPEELHVAPAVAKKAISIGSEDETGDLSVAPAVPNMAISIVEPQTARKGCLMLEYLTKRKEKVCNEKEGRKKRKYESGHRSPLMTNPNFPDPIPASETTDEGVIMFRLN
ncbi:B2-adapt-app_C domain-containing protein [Raphanus sativus]|nr:B2-adapt-app_C domain-containing protein [Raphanus sativus]